MSLEYYEVGCRTCGGVGIIEADRYRYARSLIECGCGNYICDYKKLIPAGYLILWNEDCL